jgi:hypothetical protein
MQLMERIAENLFDVLEIYVLNLLVHQVLHGKIQLKHVYGKNKLKLVNKLQNVNSVIISFCFKIDFIFNN